MSNEVKIKVSFNDIKFAWHCFSYGIVFMFARLISSSCERSGI